MKQSGATFPAFLVGMIAGISLLSVVLRVAYGEELMHLSAEEWKEMLENERCTNSELKIR
ncbi:MAG: hypothetical protein AAB439_00265 [Patescibacteria group bacterium]